MNWIKKAGIRILKEKSKQEQMDVVEMDALYTYIKKKERKTRGWMAVDRKKMRITAFEIGHGKTSGLRKLINKIGEIILKTVCPDGYFLYEEELGKNANIKHVVSESET